MNNHIIMTILFILFVWTGFWFCWVNMISQETRERVIQRLHTLRRKKTGEELKESESSDKIQEDSSSTSITQSLLGGVKSIGSGASEVSVRLVVTAVILAIIFLFTVVLVQILGKEALMLEKLKVPQSLASLAIVVSLVTLGISGVLLLLRKEYWSGVAVLILGIWFTLGFLGAFTGMFDIPDYKPETISSKVSQEKIEWKYCQKKKFSNDEEECEYRGNVYKVKDFKYNPEEELYFEFCWGFGCAEFKSDIGSSSTGTYHNKAIGEKGIFTGFKQTETGSFTGETRCTNCRTSGEYLFTLSKVVK